MKKIVSVLLGLILCISAYAENEKVTLSYSNASFKLNNTSSGNTLSIQNIDQSALYPASAGEPNLPYYIVNVAVPLNAKFKDVEISANEEIHSQGVEIEHAQPPVPFMYKSTSMAKPIPANQSIYSSNEFFPANKVKFTGEHKLNNYKYFSFLVSPFSYNPVTKILKISQQIDLNIIYDNSDTRSVKNRDDGTFHQMTQSIVVNPTSVFSTAQRASDSDTKYLIITSNDLKPSFLPLVSWKTQKGVKAAIITTEEIKKNYTGATTQLKIKECIRDYNTKYGTIYYMLAGDDKIIPDVNTYGFVYSNPPAIDNTMPADLFYATFDKAFDWNANGIAPAGEPNDDVDLAPEVIVTRASVNTPQNAQIFVNKVLNYEQNPPKKDFANKLAMTGTTLWLETDEYVKTNVMFQNHISNNWLPASEKSYDWFMSSKVDLTYDKTKATSNYNFTHSNLAEVLNRGYGFFHMATHGNQQLWATEDGEFSTEDAIGLTNKNNQGVVVTIACITNAFDTDGRDAMGGVYNQELCLSEAFLRSPKGGAVAYLGSSRFGWGNMNPIESQGTSFEYNNYFFKNLFTGVPSDKKYKFGAVVNATKSNFASLAASGGGAGTYSWVMYNLNPMGDPEMDIYTTNPTEFALSDIPKTVKVGSNNITLNTGVNGAIACLWQENSIYQTVTADASGKIALNFNTTKSGILKLTVTAHNKIPLQKNIVVDDGIPLLYTVEPSEINLAIKPATTTTAKLNLTNTGGKPFEYSLNFSYTNPTTPEEKQIIQDGNSVSAFGLAISSNGGYIGEKFTKETLSNYAGKMKINKVLYYLSSESSSPSKVSSLKIKIWEESNGLPSKVIFEGTEISSSVAFNKYSEYTLPTPISIESGKNYYVGYYIKGTGYPVGLDTEKSVGGSFYDYYGDNKWKNLDSWFGSSSSNFKIRLGLTNGLMADSWFSLENNSGSVALNGNKEINLSINTQNLKQGDLKHGNIVISCLGKEDIVVPVKLSVGSTSVKEDDTKNHVIIGNYPNPFNPETTIHFNLPTNENVNLSIYNIKGELVTTLINQKMSSGIHNITFDGTSYNSGIYIYKLSAGGVVKTQKMVLLK